MKTDEEMREDAIKRTLEIFNEIEQVPAWMKVVDAILLTTLFLSIGGVVFFTAIQI